MVFHTKLQISMSGHLGIHMALQTWDADTQT